MLILSHLGLLSSELEGSTCNPRILLHLYVLVFCEVFNIINIQSEVSRKSDLFKPAFAVLHEVDKVDRDDSILSLEEPALDEDGVIHFRPFGESLYDLPLALFAFFRSEIKFVEGLISNLNFFIISGVILEILLRPFQDIGAGDVHPFIMYTLKCNLIRMGHIPRAEFMQSLERQALVLPLEILQIL